MSVFFWYQVRQVVLHKGPLNGCCCKVKLKLSCCKDLLVMAAVFSRCGFYLLSFFFSSPILNGRRLGVYHTSTRCGLSANLEYRSEICRTPLAGNTGQKNVQKIRHLRTIAQLCQAISSQLRHVSTIEKKHLLNSNTSSTCPDNTVHFGPLAAEICWRVWGTL